MNELPEHLGGHGNTTHIDSSVLKYAVDTLGVKTMVDVGCATGGMVREAHSIGVSAVGIDGDHTLEWGDTPVVLHDYTEGGYKNGKWDLGWSVEFLEHIDPQYLDNVFSTFGQCSYIVCTAAPPGAVGHHHVNCRSSEYWIETFDHYGFDYQEKQSSKIREMSSMPLDFMRKTGMLYKNRG